MRTNPAPPAEGTVLYAEDHCALRWPLIFHAVFWPILLAASIIVLVVTRNPDLSFLLAIPLAGLAQFGSSPLNSTGRSASGSPTSGVSIGGFAARRRQHAGHHSGDPGALPPATAQRTQVFSCPRPATRHIEVVTDRGRMKELARSWTERPDNDPGHATGPVHDGRTRHPGRPQPGHGPGLPAARYEAVLVRKLSWPGPFRVSPTWYAPTRRPAELRAALDNLDSGRPGAGLTQGLSGSGGHPG